jgi:oligopeptide transport system substrate-binding protein
LAIDRQVIVNEVTRLGQLPAFHLIPPGIPGYEQPVSHIRLDVARAQQLLAEAGFPGGRGFPTIGILYNTQDLHKRIAEVLADQLRQNLGIDVRPYNQEWQSYLATWRTDQYDIARGSWIGDYLDPNTFLDLFITNGSNNHTGFSSPTYDSLLRGAANMVRFAEQPERLLAKLDQPSRVRELLARRAATSDRGEARRLLEQARSRLMTEAEAILVQEEFPILPIYYYVNTSLIAPGLRGIYPEIELPDGTRGSNLQPIHPVRDMWFESPNP